MSPTIERLAVAVPFLFAMFGCRAAPADDRSTPEERTRALLQQLIDQRETPGLQYAFLDANGVRFSAQAGRADVGKGSKVEPQTLFHGYSMTKTFTAAAIVKLAQEGKLDLDARVSTYLPELDDARSPTLRQVLAHTGGFANPIPLGWSHLATDQAFDEDAFVKRIFAAHGRVERAPGTAFAYSNVGYLVLGEVVHRVSGRRFTRYVEDELLAPLRLQPHERLEFEMRDPTEHARGYIARWSGLNASLGLFVDRGTFIAGTHDGWTEFEDMQVDGPAYGGLMGNTAGFARYLQALLRQEAPFTAELQQELFTQQKTNDGAPVPMALSWFVGALSDEPWFDHAGGGGGYYCELRLYPRLGRASVLLFNRTGIKNDHLLDRIDPPLLEASR